MSKYVFRGLALLTIFSALLVSMFYARSLLPTFAASSAATNSSVVTSHWLYVVVDGGAYVYDIDRNHALVKHIAMPVAGKRGVAVSPSRGLLYVSMCGQNVCAGKSGSLLAYDLVHDKVAWTVKYPFGVDQMAVTPDGSAIYMPHGTDSSDGVTSILDASNGKVIGSITTGTNGHNTVASLDGTQVYLGGYAGKNFTSVHVVNPATKKVIFDVAATSGGIRPFTVNGKHTMLYTTASNTCGFQIESIVTKKLISSVKFAGSCAWSASTAPSHGISLSPDEKRVYVMDAPLDKLMVYDVMNPAAPRSIASVQLNALNGSEVPCQTYCEKEGWTLNDLSGRYVYVADAGNVIDTRTNKSVAVLAPLQNTRQVIEVDFTGGLVSATSTRFGIGRIIH